MSDHGHAKLGPSAAKRWMKCTASVGLIDELGAESETSAAAEEGRAAHTVLEMRLMERLMERGHRFEAGRFGGLCEEVERLKKEE